MKHRKNDREGNLPVLIICQIYFRNFFRDKTSADNGGEKRGKE